MSNKFTHAMTDQDKKQLITIINTGMCGDVTSGMAAAFQLLGSAVHEGAVNKDDVWDIFKRTYHTDEEYQEMMENPDPLAFLQAIFM